MLKHSRSGSACLGELLKNLLCAILSSIIEEKQDMNVDFKRKGLCLNIKLAATLAALMKQSKAG